ncbi:hypothetical protein JCM3766R1_006120 [Sporobolomyces carnicolor]
MASPTSSIPSVLEDPAGDACSISSTHTDSTTASMHSLRHTVKAAFRPITDPWLNWRARKGVVEIPRDKADMLKAPPKPRRRRPWELSRRDPDGDRLPRNRLTKSNPTMSEDEEPVDAAKNGAARHPHLRQPRHFGIAIPMAPADTHPPHLVPFTPVPREDPSKLTIRPISPLSLDLEPPKGLEPPVEELRNSAPRAHPTRVTVHPVNGDDNNAKPDGRGRIPEYPDPSTIAVESATATPRRSQEGMRREDTSFEQQPGFGDVASYQRKSLKNRHNLRNLPKSIPLTTAPEPRLSPGPPEPTRRDRYSANIPQDMKYLLRHYDPEDIGKY